MFRPAAHARFTTRAGLYLEPIPGLAWGNHAGPGRFVDGGEPRGLFGAFVSGIGPVWGALDLKDEGLRWRPKWLARRWGFRAFEIPWSSVRAADLQLMWMEGPTETLLLVDVVSGERLEFTIPRFDRGALESTLGLFLERPSRFEPPLGLA